MKDLIGMSCFINCSGPICASKAGGSMMISKSRKRGQQENVVRAYEKERGAGF